MLLHLGQVIYGNVGVPERLQFTLVGPAVNVVVRVQDLTKVLGSALRSLPPHPSPRPSRAPGARSANTFCAGLRRRYRF
jgi:class 3 adenylate cyclase